MSSEPLNTISRHNSVSEHSYDYSLYSPIKGISIKKENKCLTIFSYIFILYSATISLAFNSAYFVNNIANSTNITNLTGTSIENKYFIYILLYNSCLSLAQILYLANTYYININMINICGIIAMNAALAIFDQLLPLPNINDDIYTIYFYGKVVVVLYFPLFLLCNLCCKRA